MYHGITIDNAKDLDLCIQMYNLLEYTSDTTEPLCFYSKDEAAYFNNATADDNDDFISFKYKIWLIGSTESTNVILKDATIASKSFLEINWNAID